MKRWIENIQKGTTFSGIEWLIQENAVSIRFVQLVRKREGLVQISAETIPDVASLKRALGNKSAFLVVDGSPILTKFTKEGTESQKVVSGLFPNLDPEAFYYEISEIRSHTAVSICRKEIIEEILSVLADEKIHLTGYTFGVHALQPVLPHLEDETLYFSGKCLQFASDRVTMKSVETPITTYDINGSIIKPSFLLSFSAALLDFFGGTTSVKNFENEIRHLTNEYREKRFFRLFGISALSLLLVLLLVNFFLFQHYYSGSEELKQMVAINQGNKDKLLQLNETADRKAKLVEDLLEASSSKSSFYIDRLVSKAPQSIVFEELNYQPIPQRVKPDKEIVFQYNELVIRGEASRSDEFSIWVEAMEKFDWVEKIEVLDYGVGDDPKTEFGIAIFLKDE